MKKALVFGAFAASCFATFPLSQVSAQAPAGGFQRCLNAGNTPQYCEERRRQLNNGTIKPDCNFGRGPTRQPKMVNGQLSCGR